MIYTLEQRSDTLFWYILRDGRLIAGFLEKELAEQVFETLKNTNEANS